MAEQATAACCSLAVESARLAEMVEEFRLTPAAGGVRGLAAPA